VVIVTAFEPISTNNTYSGEITLVIEGSVTTTALNDALYQHTDNNGFALSTPSTNGGMLRVNNEPLQPAQLQDYQPFHVYSIPYNAGTTPTPLIFQLQEDVRGGELRVFIVEAP
jgi:hypothetical protein